MSLQIGFLALALAFLLGSFATASDPLFERLATAFDNGTMPESNDFDPLRTPYGTSVNEGGISFNGQLITAEIKGQKYALFFRLTNPPTGAPVTRESAQASISQMVETKHAEPLERNELARLFMEDIGPYEDRCAQQYQFRRAEWEGRTVLLMKCIQTDSRPVCKPGTTEAYALFHAF